MSKLTQLLSSFVFIGWMIIARKADPSLKGIVHSNDKPLADGQDTGVRLPLSDRMWWNRNTQLHIDSRPQDQIAKRHPTGQRFYRNSHEESKKDKDRASWVF